MPADMSFPGVMRSKLFVPGSRPELFPKALAGQADALSFDLEDAVGENKKGIARGNVGTALVRSEFLASPKTIIVRINRFGSPFFAADLEAVALPRLDLLNLPKVESPDEIRAVAQALARLESDRGISRPIEILANIESPRGLRLAAEIAAADPRVAGLQLGLGDLFESLGIDRRDTSAVQQVQLMVRLAAGEAGIWACDSAYGDTKAADSFRAEASAARRLGYMGKSCIHPSQVGIANEVFQPSATEIAFARRVVDAAGRTDDGAFTVDGKMIDAPFLRRARAVLAIANPPPS